MNLDIKADKDILRRELPVLREESLRTMEVATTLLKLCAVDGLSLNEIGEIMSRPLTALDDGESELEKICMSTKQQLFALVSEDGLTIGSDDGSGFESPRVGDDLLFDFDDMKGEMNFQFFALGVSYAQQGSDFVITIYGRFEPFIYQKPR